MPSIKLASTGEFVVSGEQRSVKLTQKGLTGSTVIALEHKIDGTWEPVSDSSGAVELSTSRTSITINAPGRYRAQPGAATVQVDY